MDNKQLIEYANNVQIEKELNHFIRIGKVGSALLAFSGKVFTGISIEAACGIGFCAEHSAIAEMLKNDENRILKIVAVNKGQIIAPCGRCRELIRQIHYENLETEIIMPQEKIMKLKDLLPEPFHGTM